MDWCCLSVSLSVCLALTGPRRQRPWTAAIDSFTVAAGEIGRGGGTPPPPPPPTLLFGQLIDLLTPAARHVSLNLISEFISGWTCAHRNDVEFPPRNRVKDRG